MPPEFDYRLTTSPSLFSQLSIIIRTTSFRPIPSPRDRSPLLTPNANIPHTNTTTLPPAIERQHNHKTKRRERRREGNDILQRSKSPHSPRLARAIHTISPTFSNKSKWISIMPFIPWPSRTVIPSHANTPASFFAVVDAEDRVQIGICPSYNPTCSWRLFPTPIPKTQARSIVALLKGKER